MGSLSNLADRAAWIRELEALRAGMPASLKQELALTGRDARLAWDLTLLQALCGYSFRWEIQEAVARLHDIGPHSGGMRRALGRLGETLWEVRRVRTVTTVILVRLRPWARAELAAAGIPVVPSEWAQIEERHRGGPLQPRHTAAMLVFAYHARQRGYRVTLCPDTPIQGTEPDLRLDRAGRGSYVEVEGRSGNAVSRTAKWRGLAQLQGYVAVCAYVAGAADYFRKEAESQGYPVCVTDLRTLHRVQPPSLWTYRTPGLEEV